MSRYLPIVAALGLIVGAGALQGVWTDRWAQAYDFESKTVALRSLPLKIGNWTGRDREFDAKAYSHAGIRCGVERQYVNSMTGQSVSMLIVGGAAGPISVHTPETCYAAAGYEMQGSRVPYVVPEESTAGPGNAFWVARFQNKAQAIGHDLSIYYGWSSEGHWLAPEGDARLTFASKPALFKLYVIQEILHGQDPAKATACDAFLRDALGTISKTLFSGNTPTVAAR